MHFQLIFARPRRLKRQRTTFRPIAGNIRRAFYATLVYLNRLLNLFLNSTVQVRGNVTSKVTLTIRGGGVLRLATRGSTAGTDRVRF